MHVTALDRTHDASATSWVESANVPAADFPIQNLPFAEFRTMGTTENYRGGVAIGAAIVDLAALHRTGVLAGLAAEAARACAEPTLNAFFALGRDAWRTLRHELFALLHADATSEAPAGVDAVKASLVDRARAQFTLPAAIGDYTDFYTSIHHARATMKIFDPNATLSPNFQWIPAAYHGRASSVVPAGTDVRRPHGQVVLVGEAQPRFVPTRRLDYELEIGIFIGSGNVVGESIAPADAEQHIFGLCLLNDWSARDIQAWEMAPLGPFASKNFATTISPWIVTMEALAPFRLPWTREAGEAQPLPHLDAPAIRDGGALDIELEVFLETERMRSQQQPPARLSRTNFKHQYWTIAQMVTHHAAGGCNLQIGDLLGSGTISGPLPEEAGAMIELAAGGQKPVTLPNGETRSFLEDGDAVIFEAWCERPGFARIGFGRNEGVIAPASPQPHHQGLGSPHS